jgi:fructokinase
MIRIGIDLGGTKIEIVALAPDGRELLRRRVQTPGNGYDAIVRTLVDLVHKAEKELGERGSVGIGAPGALSRATGRIKNSNSTWLIGKPLPQDLESLLDRPIRISNDANCFALSEARDGAGAGASVVFGAIVGTGPGGGLVVHGRVLNGPNGIAGEWGHNPLPWPRREELPGPACYCGKTGCIETFLSGPGMAADHQRVSGALLDPKTIAFKALGGDSGCRATLARYEDRMARALAHVINIVDPEVIVLGGGISNIRQLYTDVPRLWGRYVFSDRVDTRIAAPRHGDAIGVRGAALLWED